MGVLIGVGFMSLFLTYNPQKATYVLTDVHHEVNADWEQKFKDDRTAPEGQRCTAGLTECANQTQNTDDRKDELHAFTVGPPQTDSENHVEKHFKVQCPTQN